MRYTTFLYYLLFSFFTLQLSAQQANEILGIAKENKSKAYYQEQAGLWKKEIRADPQNGYAWFQHYKARRAYLQLSDPETWRENPKAAFAQLAPIIQEAESSIKGTYYYYLLKAVNTRFHDKIEWLEKAYQANPDGKEVYESLLIHYARNFKNEQAAEMAKKMLAANYYSNANLMWNYNTLQTVAPNGIYIANGDMDNMPKWVLQQGQDIRKDVLVVSKTLLAADADYRKNVGEKVGISFAGISEGDYANFSDYADALSVYVLKNSPRPAYMGCGTNVKLFKKHDIEGYIFLVGLAFRYSERNFNNMAAIKDHFENKYRTGYLLTNFQVHTDDEMVNRYMNVTYLPGLMELKEHYQKNGQKDRLAYCRQLIDHIIKKSGRKDEIQSWFE